MNLWVFAGDGLVTFGIASRGPNSNPIEIWNAARRKKSPVTIEQHYDRVLTGYQLNEQLMKSRSRRTLKNVLNGV